jgi:hypothetical protein
LDKLNGERRLKLAENRTRIPIFALKSGKNWLHSIREQPEKGEQTKKNIPGVEGVLLAWTAFLSFPIRWP